MQQPEKESERHTEKEGVREKVSAYVYKKGQARSVTVFLFQTLSNCSENVCACVCSST